MGESHCTETLIALLEWELAAAQAREAELRRRADVLLQGRRTDFHRFIPHAGHMHRLAVLLDEPMDDRRLSQRLESARYEATR